METLNILKKEAEKKGKILKESEPRLKSKPDSPKSPTISFDAYFRLLMKEGKAQAHHKAPLKEFMKQQSLLEATKAEFDQIFSKY